MDPQEPQPASARPPEGSVRDHLANERTMLAWQRTALALIGLGFVVDRFAFEGRGDAALGTVMGILLIAGGAITAVTGAWRYTQVEHQIDQGTFGSTVGAHVILAGAITVGAFVIGLYLLTSG
jgi:putative membrane protein